jgi:hypothetical protein
MRSAPRSLVRRRLSGWALELDRVLRAMDERHWLIWTSRPAPLKAGLRRIHREHGVERFPQPAEVQIDAANLEVAEKALILFRHAKAAVLPERAVELVRAEGWRIVSHPHFTPERIRRFVAGRLLELADRVGSAGDIDELVSAEIREPTVAMTASFHALSGEHRGLLLALLDTPPRPVSARELAAAFRRHAATGLRQQPEQLVDRLTDHFLRLVNEGGVTWVHPSWRDLVIDELVGDRVARQKFLRACSIEGILLAVSTAGGATGERLLPLVRDDQDWDALSDRLAVMIVELDDPDINRLFVTLAEARAALPADDQSEPPLSLATCHSSSRDAGTRSVPSFPSGYLRLGSTLRRCSTSRLLPRSSRRRGSNCYLATGSISIRPLTSQASMIGPLSLNCYRSTHPSS